MPSEHRPAASAGRGPRLLPLLALAFLGAWLGRDLVVDAGLLAAPPPPAAQAPANETFAIALRQLAPAVPQKATIDLVTGPGVGDAVYWLATYQLYPHHLRVNPPATSAAADIVVVVRTAGPTPDLAGYAVIERVSGPNAVVVAFRRADR